MSDLLASLLVANSSQESFHSSCSQPPPSSGPATSSSPDANPPASSQRQASAFQDTGFPVYDIDLYLADTEDAASSTPAPNKRSSSQHESTQVISNQLEPVPLGSKKPRYHVSALNTLCQAKGLTPVFEIDGLVDFGGVVKIGGTTVTSEERWRSKKDAKEGLAEKSLDVVKTMDAKGKQSDSSGEAGKNWVGMLLEYHNCIDPSRGPIYEEYVLGSTFSCECIIASRPTQLFGSKTEMFSSKKAARVNAAKQAVEHLISEGELNPDGSTKAKKKTMVGAPIVGAAVRMEGKGLKLKVSRNSSYAQKVNDICPLLGLSAPQYKLAPVSALAPNMLSGYASFPSQPGVPEEIGEARNVYGKKNAKEEVAEGVWKFLLELAKKRDVEIEETGGSGLD